MSNDPFNNTAVVQKKRQINVSRISAPYIMILPAMVGIALFYLYPVFETIYLSFFKYNMLNKSRSKFIGIKNYTDLFGDSVFFKVLQNTLIYTVATVALTVIISMLVAMWINKTSVMDKVMQVGIFTPHIISNVSVAFIWMWMMDPSTGLINYVLHLVGLPTSQWLNSSKSALASIILVSVWKGIGYYVLILIAALQSIPTSILEAANLDNAKGATLFFKITLPLISPQLFFILIIMTISSFKVFDTVQIMTMGGPNNATNTLVYYIYQFRSIKIGYASATAVVLMVLIGILTVFYFRLLSKKVHYN